MTENLYILPNGSAIYLSKVRVFEISRQTGKVMVYIFMNTPRGDSENIPVEFYNDEDAVRFTNLLGKEVDTIKRSLADTLHELPNGGWVILKDVTAIIPCESVPGTAYVYIHIGERSWQIQFEDIAAAKDYTRQLAVLVNEAKRQNS